MDKHVYKENIVRMRFLNLLPLFVFYFMHSIRLIEYIRYVMCGICLENKKNEWKKGGRYNKIQFRLCSSIFLKGMTLDVIFIFLYDLLMQWKFNFMDSWRVVRRFNQSIIYWKILLTYFIVCGLHSTCCNYELVKAFSFSFIEFVERWKLGTEAGTCLNMVICGFTPSSPIVFKIIFF